MDQSQNIRGQSRLCALLAAVGETDTEGRYRVPQRP
jgi:hypothetical protein